MSCLLHGNPEDECEECAALDAKYDAGFAAGREAMSAEKRARELDPEDYIRMEDAFEQFAEGRDLTPDTWGVSKYVSPHVDNDWDVWRKAWAAALTPQWQEISTAPRDGTRVLVAGGKWVGDWPEDRNYMAEPHVASWEAHSDRSFWAYELPAGVEEAGCGITAPTHWLPLPAPPENVND